MPRPLGSKNKNTERMQLLEKQLSEEKAQNKIIRQELANAQKKLALQQPQLNTEPISQHSTQGNSAKRTPLSKRIFNINENGQYPTWVRGEIACASRYQKKFLVEVVRDAQSQFEIKTFTEDHSKRCRGSGFYYPPNPLALPTKPEPFHHYLKPIFIWRPDISFNLPQISCTANKCHGSLKSDGLYQNGPRKYVSLQNYGYIVTWSYRCSSCSKKLCGWSEEFLKVLPPHVQQWFPFTLRKKSAIHHQIIELISLSFGDLRIAEIERLIAGYHSSKYLQDHALYLQRCVAYKELLSNQQRLIPLEDSAKSFEKFSKLEDSGGYDGLRSIDCADIVKSYFEAEEEYYDVVQRRIVDDKILCTDHSHKVNKYINIPQRKYFKSALFTGMTSSGHIAFSTLTHTKSHSDAKPILEGYKQRLEKRNMSHPKRIWLDHPTADVSLYKSVFNTERYGKDLFHFKQCYTSVILKEMRNPLWKQWDERLSEALTVTENGDVKLRQKQDILTRLETLYREFASIPNFFNADSGRKHENMLEIVRNDWLSEDENEETHIELPNGKKVTIRGTSQPESFHRQIITYFRGYSMGPQLANLLLKRIVFEWNVRVWKKFEEPLALLCQNTKDLKTAEKIAVLLKDVHPEDSACLPTIPNDVDSQECLGVAYRNEKEI